VSTKTTSGGSITVASATAIGVGGMMGAGLYTLIGLASTTAGVWLPVAFLVGGAVSVFSVYSYAKLGARYPSRGGAAQFLIRCFGDGVIAGGLNVFQFLGWIIAMALYCAGFAGYIRALLPWETPEWSGKLIGIGLIVAVVFVNMMGSKLVGRSELFVVTIELRRGDQLRR
jgi:amino acid transporter